MFSNSLTKPKISVIINIWIDVNGMERFARFARFAMKYNKESCPNGSDKLTVDGSTYSHIASEEPMSSDAPGKKLLFNKGALAIIIKSLIDDCGKYSYIEIGDKIGSITGDRQVTADVSEEGIRRLQSEGVSVLEKLIRYDVYLNFNDKDKDTGKDRLSTIDIEIQQELPADYPLVKRGLYYAFRSVCSQLGDITGVTNYGKLHKVYSIWLMVKQDENRKAGIATLKYKFSGNVELMPENYDSDSDLVQLDFVFAGDMSDIDSSKRDLFYLVNGMNRDPRLLKELFTYELPEKSDFVKEADDIMTFQERFEAIGEARGEARGVAIGEARGVTRTKAEIALKMYSFGVSKDIISQCTGLSIKEIDELIKEKPQTENHEEPYVFG